MIVWEGGKHSHRYLLKVGKVIVARMIVKCGLGHGVVGVHDLHMERKKRLLGVSYLVIHSMQGTI